MRVAKYRHDVIMDFVLLYMLFNMTKIWVVEVLFSVSCT